MNEKILVTLGTTNFDSLIDIFDVKTDKYEFEFQIGHSIKKPKNNPYFDFKSQDSLYEGYDFIVSHAGAGSVFKLLELKKKILVVTNHDRNDQHQSELASFIGNNNFALVYEIEHLKNLDFLDVIHSLDIAKFSPYMKDNFMTEKLINFFEGK